MSTNHNTKTKLLAKPDLADVEVSVGQPLSYGDAGPTLMFRTRGRRVRRVAGLQVPLRRSQPRRSGPHLRGEPAPANCCPTGTPEPPGNVSDPWSSGSAGGWPSSSSSPVATSPVRTASTR